MKVLGAIDAVEGNSRHERIQNVAQMTFVDEEGNPYRFTWRTIQTWYYRYKSKGITGMTNHPRADKGSTRKVTPEEVLEAINTALPHFQKDEKKKRKHNKSAIYRFCIEKGLLRADQIARTTFCRFIEEYEMLKDDVSENKRRLAFSMQYANQLWQADTMFGPHVQRRQAKLIAFIDDASRVIRARRRCRQVRIVEPLTRDAPKLDVATIAAHKRWLVYPNEWPEPSSSLDWQRQLMGMELVCSQQSSCVTSSLVS